jgi:hypothetical protein
MKKQDLFYLGILIILVLPFFSFGFLENFHKSYLFNDEHWISTSFLKFAVLASMGEILGARIKSGKYEIKGFGIVPKAIVWGFIGISVKIAFVILAFGVPSFMEKYLWVSDAKNSMSFRDVTDSFNNGLGWTRVLCAFLISTTMNIVYAPVMMTFHKITDIHITDNHGSLKSIITPVKYGEIFAKINWKLQWDFIFKKTIPFFWIPAHTITFMIANEYRIIFAAFLSVALGIMLALASQRNIDNN